jgi:hypothetical protein
MCLRRAAVLAAAVLVSLVPAASADQGVKPRAGVSLSGTVKFPRAQAMAIRTDRRDGSRLTAAMAFDGRCTGSLREAWVSNVPTRSVVRVKHGRFVATLTGSVRRLGGDDAHSGQFRWRLRGRFLKEDVVAVTVSGSAKVRSHGTLVARCKIARPATARLTVRSH